MTNGGDMQRELIEDEAERLEQVGTHPCPYDPEQICAFHPDQKVKAIGTMNGWWAMLFKAYLIGSPIFAFILTVVIIPWGKWQTDQQYEDIAYRKETTTAMTQVHDSLALIATEIKELRADHKRDVDSLDQKIANLPHEEWKRRIVLLEDHVEKTNATINSVLIAIEQVKFKLGIPNNGGGG